MAVYPLADRLPGIPTAEQRDYAAQSTGESRQPRAGEWYLSGAIVEAYRCPADGMLSEYVIARIVRRDAALIEAALVGPTSADNARRLAPGVADNLRAAGYRIVPMR